MIFRLYRWYKKRYKSIPPAKSRAPRKLERTDPAVQQLIDMIRLFELDEYEVINPVLNHYRFTFSDGTVRAPVSIVEIAGYIDLLKEHGLYRQTVKREEPASIIDITPSCSSIEKDSVKDAPLNNAKVLPFKRK